MLRKTKTLKKQRYRKEVVDRILWENTIYWEKFFKDYATRTGNKFFIPKKRRNGDLTMLCPIHKERTPSLRVNARTNICKCFGCGFSGNFLTLLQRVYDISFIEALEMAFKMKDFINEDFNPLQLKITFHRDLPAITSSYRENEESDGLPF